MSPRCALILAVVVVSCILQSSESARHSVIQRPSLKWIKSVVVLKLLKLFPVNQKENELFLGCQKWPSQSRTRWGLCSSREKCKVLSIHRGCNKNGFISVF